MYERAGMDAPSRIVWCGSPMSLIFTHMTLRRIAANPELQRQLDAEAPGDSVRASVWASVWDSVGASVWASVWDSVGASVWASVWDSVRASVRASVGASVRASVWDSVRASVWDSVRASVRASVGASVRASVWDSVRASVRASVGASVRASVWDSVWDSVGASVRASVGASVWDSVGASVGASVRASVWDSVWDSVGASVWEEFNASYHATVETEYLAPGLAFYAAFNEVFGLAEETQRLDGLWEFAKSAGWMIPCRNIAFVCERHNILNLDDRGMLHSETAPAVEYPDGYQIFAVHGVRVPGWLIQNPERLSMAEIDRETNAEVQRVMIDRFGWDRFLEESKAEIVDHDEVRGTLYRTQRSPGVDPILMVLVTNRTAEPDGTFKKYILPVHHELRPLPDLDEDPNGRLGEPQKLTAHNAVASTFGLYGREYAPEMES